MMFAMSPIVRSYEELLVLSEQMLDAARASNWDALTDLQKVYMAEVDRLRLLVRQEAGVEAVPRDVAVHAPAHGFQLLEQFGVKHGANFRCARDSSGRV